MNVRVVRDRWWPSTWTSPHVRAMRPLANPIATSAEKDVRLRFASRSSRLARDAGIEMVRRTALMG